MCLENDSMGCFVKTREKLCKAKMPSTIISFRYDWYIFLLELEPSLEVSLVCFGGTSRRTGQIGFTGQSGRTGQSMADCLKSTLQYESAHLND